MPANISMGLGCETHIKKIWGHFQVQTTIGFDLMTSWEQFVIIERAFLPSTIKKMSDVELYFFVKSKIWQGVSQESEYFEKAIQNFSFKTKWEKIVLEYMDKELDAQSRVQDLAKLVNMSSDGLSRSFQKRYGISLKKYMLGQLNQKVCMSLMQPSMPIKEVAKLYNFQDEHYFYQFFKKHNLQTPKKFRISQGL
ncbi:MAG: AraC family transcriptional regulator [Lentisphaeria bacterium]|nr:AraC family transcriptional regulator [Lentisphaeria bacterium]